MCTIMVSYAFHKQPGVHNNQADIQRENIAAHNTF